MTTATVRPNRPHARTVRAALRAAGLEHHVEKVTTSSKLCRIHLRIHAAGPAVAGAVAAAVRPLWHDGDRRVRVPHSYAVWIDVHHWIHTVPNTSDGLAWLAVREAERNADLFWHRQRGRFLATIDRREVRHEPTDDDPHRPWIDRDGRRHPVRHLRPLVLNTRRRPENATTSPVGGRLVFFFFSPPCPVSGLLS